MKLGTRTVSADNRALVEDTGKKGRSPMSQLKSYYVSFRVNKRNEGLLDRPHGARIEELVSLIEDMAHEERVDGQTCSRLMFRSEVSIEDIAEEIRECMSDGDVAVVGVYNSERVKVVGKITYEDELQIA